ncbi:MAG: hypothetical protein ACRDXC_13965 [Acidimicrobiales bacterium]
MHDYMEAELLTIAIPLGFFVTSCLWLFFSRRLRMPRPPRS